jgi:hypothetical protein
MWPVKGLPNAHHLQLGHYPLYSVDEANKRVCQMVDYVVPLVLHTEVFTTWKELWL